MVLLIPVLGTHMATKRPVDALGAKANGSVPIPLINPGDVASF
jgi:hypothetical protein